VLICEITILGRIRFYFTSVDESLCAGDLNQFYHREWIQRAWTFQELILASNPVILCSTRSLEWGPFLNALYYRRERFWATRLLRYKSRKVGEESSRIKAMMYWHLMANLWLQFPRPSSWNGVLISANYPMTNMDPNNPSSREPGSGLRAWNESSAWLSCSFAVFWRLHYSSAGVGCSTPWEAIGGPDYKQSRGRAIKTTKQERRGQPYPLFPQSPC